jgi:hypothetical protein
MFIVLKLGWNKKTSIKVVELVQHGYTTVREKGKITRIKMPTCKVSSKSTTNKEENEKLNTLPRTINIQLEPRNESAFCRVHRLAQNPFLTIDIRTLQSVAFLIEFLENKWKNRQNQFLEQFQIEREDEKESTKYPSENNYSENIILYPNESHTISNVDLFEQSTTTTTTAVPKPTTPQPIPLATPISVENDADNIKLTDNTQNSNEKVKSNFHMTKSEDLEMSDDANDAIPAMETETEPETEVDNPKVSKKTSTTKKNPPTSRYSFQLLAKQLRNGLTKWNSKSIESNNDNNHQEFTVMQLYLAFNKPAVIKLKYDWVSTTAPAISSSVDRIVGPNLATSSLINQRFYIDTLKSVAEAFLSELQKPSTSSVATTSGQTTCQQKQQQEEIKSNAEQQQQQQQLSPPQPPSKMSKTSLSSTPTTPRSTTNNNNSPKVAFILPNDLISSKTSNTNLNSSPTTIAGASLRIVPIDTVLQQINDEQALKTKKLLSDLTSKRRTRQQRKPMMMVNSSGQPGRNIAPLLPKLIIQQVPSNNNNNNNNTATTSDINSIQTNQANTSSTLNNNDNNNQHNIVFSGPPVSAVVRQTVTTSSSLLCQNQNHELSKQQQSIGNIFINHQPEINYINDIDPNLPIQKQHSSFNYSNLLDSSIQFKPTNECASSCFNESDLQQQHSEVPSSGVVSPNGLTNMSLLDLSINNNDSIFATRLNNSNNNSTINNDNNNMILPSNNTITGRSTITGEQIIISAININNNSTSVNKKETTSQLFGNIISSENDLNSSKLSQSDEVIILNENSQNSNLNSLTNILNSLNTKSNSSFLNDSSNINNSNNNDNNNSDITNTRTEGLTKNNDSISNNNPQASSSSSYNNNNNNLQQQQQQRHRSDLFPNLFNESVCLFIFFICLYIFMLKRLLYLLNEFRWEMYRWVLVL